MKPLALSLLLGTSLTAAAVEKPNIIMIYIDDMGYGDVGCYGGKYTPTPNIDKIAEDGVRFTQFYVAAPISSASRTGITTGMYPCRWGITSFLHERSGNKTCEQNDYLNAQAPSLARALKTNGYATGHFGKWHMGGGRDVTDAPSIKSYGFDEYSSTWESPDPDKLLTASNWIWSNQDSIKRWNRTAYFVDKTLDFLRKNPHTPCYVNLWPDDVHTPWVPYEQVQDLQNTWEKPETFSPVLAELDKQIGRLLEGIKKLGIEENTIIIFSSDNGPNPSFKNVRTANLRGQKATLFEGGIRVPLIVKWPGHVKPEQTNEGSVMCTVDLFPSLCKITGTQLPTQYKLDGEDMSATLFANNQNNRKNPLFWMFGKHLPIEKRMNSPYIAMRDGKWKLLVEGDGSHVMLFNLETDRNETDNLADKEKKITKKMSAKAITWFKKSFREFADKK